QDHLRARKAFRLPALDATSASQGDDDLAARSRADGNTRRRPPRLRRRPDAAVPESRAHRAAVPDAGLQVGRAGASLRGGERGYRSTNGSSSLRKKSSTWCSEMSAI